MSFNMTTNYANNDRHDGYDPLPTGEYEMVINHATERATKNGKESLQLDLVVRNDLDGASEANKKYHNRHVFMDNWKRNVRNPETGAMEYTYAMDQLQLLLEAVGVPEGTQINSVEDFCAQFEHKPVQVYVKKETSEYNGESRDENTVAPWNVRQTKFPQLGHKFGKDDGAQSTPAQSTPAINDNDLPF